MRKIIALLILLCLTLPLSAEEFQDWYADLSEWAGVDPHAGLLTFLSLNTPAGGLYEGMGSAFTAVSEDSGFFESNPASSSIMPTTILSFQHNYWIASSEIEGMIYSIRFDNLGIGFGGKFLRIPFDGIGFDGLRYQNDGMTSSGIISETLLAGNLSYNLFPSFYFGGIALGGNFKLGYRHVPPAIYPGQSFLVLMADLGALFRFNFLKFYSSRSRNFSLGLAVSNIGPPAEFDEALPTEASAGIAWRPWQSFLFTFDFNLPINLVDFTQSEQPSIAAGFLVDINDMFSYHGGILLKQGMPRLTTGAEVSFGVTSFTFNFTLDLTTISLPDRLSIEASVNLGDLGRMERKNRAQDLYVEGLEEYALGNLEAAVELWTQALEYDPELTPAVESLSTVEKSLNLQRQMEETRQLGVLSDPAASTEE